MGYRRTKDSARRARLWKDFLQGNATLLAASGVPASLYESREMFDDLLMHGYIDHHADPTHFAVGQLSDEQRTALITVIVHYLKAGYGDPGIGGFMGSMRDEILRRARSGKS